MAKPIRDLANELYDKTVDNLLSAMTLSYEERSKLSLATMSQSLSSQWMQQRTGRITASNSKQVYTRARTLMSKPKEDASTVVGKILQYTQIPMTEAMKYGISTEIKAKSKFSQIMNKGHEHYTQSAVGLVVHQTRPYIAASPDLLVSCHCHGGALCEIKCPYSISTADKITPENYTHLERTASGCIALKKTSPYYYQIQHQLGVTGQEYGYFFVYIPNAYHLEKIDFDRSLWADMQDKFEYLWRYYVAPEILKNTDCTLLTP